MTVFRIVKSKNRINDLSGTGAFRVGGRWNQKGTYMLYTSENSSLAYLESLVHFTTLDFPINLHIIHLNIDDNAPIYRLPDKEYPKNWMEIGNAATQEKGTALMNDNHYLAIRVKSAINPEEYNYLLNPLFPDFQKMVRVISSAVINTDRRLIE